MTSANTIFSLLLLLNAGALIFIAIQAAKLKVDLKQLDRLQLRLGAKAAEQLRLVQSQQQIAEIQDVTEAVVDGSTAAVRTVHKEIADVTFDALDSIPVTRDTSKLVRGIHDVTADGVYGSIGIVNKLLGKGTRAGLGIKDGEKKKDSDEK